MKKRFIAVLLACSMVLSLGACGQRKDSSDGRESEKTSSQREDPADPSDAGDPIKLRIGFSTDQSDPRHREGYRWSCMRTENWDQMRS